MARCSLTDAFVVGVSESGTCGVRDHAVLLAAALEREGSVRCSLHWLWRSESSSRGCRAQFRAWTQELSGELDRARPDAILLHYSVFSYSYRGLPLFVRPVLATLRASGIPLITILHEPAYPWRLGGLHGKLWALTQRVALIGLMRASSAVLVTAPFRAEWLASRPWYARRPIALAPVFSNLPPPAVPVADAGKGNVAGEGASGRRSRGEHRIGLFGYAYEGAARQLVLDAVRMLLERGLPCAPGAARRSRSRRARWPRRGWPALASAGIERAVFFSGVLPRQELSNALSRLRGAAASRSLRADLAQGHAGRVAGLRHAPVVAIDGPLRWSELIDAEAALVVRADRARARRRDRRAARRRRPARGARRPRRRLRAAGDGRRAQRQRRLRGVARAGLLIEPAADRRRRSRSTVANC